jgi:Ca-activated chloride channel family protein
MYFKRRLHPATAGIAVLALGVSLGAQEPTFRSGSRVVPSYVTVVDANNRLVTDLGREDFEVFDNGRPQEITIFDNEVRPFSVAVMLDTSISMTDRMKDLYAGAEQFLLRLLPHDKGIVGAFNDKIEFASGLTSDRNTLVSGLKHLDFGNQTRLYDAVHAGLDELEKVEGRKVILLFTDGADFGSRLSSGKALERARDAEVMIYGIGLETEFFNGQMVVRSKPDSILNRFAAETGGGYFDLKKDADLNSSFTRIAQELRSQYLLGFSPATLDGKVHKLEVRAQRPDLTARSRRSYVASADGTIN